MWAKFDKEEERVYSYPIMLGIENIGSSREKALLLAGVLAVTSIVGGRVANASSSEHGIFWATDGCLRTGEHIIVMGNTLGSSTGPLDPSLRYAVFAFESKTALGYEIPFAEEDKTVFIDVISAKTGMGGPPDMKMKEGNKYDFLLTTVLKEDFFPSLESAFLRVLKSTDLVIGKCPEPASPR